MQNSRPNDGEIQLELTASPDANDIRLLGERLTRSTSMAVDAETTKIDIAVWMRQGDQVLGGAYGSTH